MRADLSGQLRFYSMCPVLIQPRDSRDLDYNPLISEPYECSSQELLQTFFDQNFHSPRPILTDKLIQMMPIGRYCSAILDRCHSEINRNCLNLNEDQNRWRRLVRMRFIFILSILFLCSFSKAQSTCSTSPLYSNWVDGNNPPTYHLRFDQNCRITQLGSSHYTLASVNGVMRDTISGNYSILSANYTHNASAGDSYSGQVKFSSLTCSYTATLDVTNGPKLQFSCPGYSTLNLVCDPSYPRACMNSAFRFPQPTSWTSYPGSIGCPCNGCCSAAQPVVPF